MVKVYFETNVAPMKRYAELVAMFDCEETYILCLPALEREAEKQGMIVTESIDGSSLDDLYLDDLYEEKGGESW